MPGAERHSGARNWRACSHRAPKKQAKGDGRAAKGQYGTYSWPMEKLMDHYGNVAAERKLRTPGSKRRPAGRFVLVGGVHGGDGGFGWCAEVRGGVHDMLQCYPAQSGNEVGGVLQAADAKLRTSCSSGNEAGGVLQAADAKLRTSCSSGDEAGGVVQAADAKLRTSCSSGDEAGGVVQAADAKLRTSCSSGDEAGGVVQAADAKLRTSCSSGDEAGGDVQAADAKLWLHGCRIAAYMSGMARVLIKQYTILN
ncbi:hypothetical protein PR001_g17462 [Phytophthora rubi]|uniref:Uncharacterized protein n=1 Tax=Phytophthora rubi TaxID=129364 RepID=A0A6A3KHX4_9STRA|nr:hypothetical protein PR001_g17462 [Phytophthora rubi]